LVIRTNELTELPPFDGVAAQPLTCVQNIDPRLIPMVRASGAITGNDAINFFAQSVERSEPF
jgi:hypothetical protein